MSSPSRQMALIAFLQAQNCSNYAGSWRHPASMPDFLAPEYYARIARTLEDAKFDMAFFDDRLAMPDIYGANHDLAVRHGIRPVKLDPTAVLMAMAMATERLGLGATYSTTYHSPFHVARLFATLDLMTKGRVAWNVVTSLNDSEAANFGVTEHLEHDLRYDRADEFMEIVKSLWSTWDPDAIVLDKENDVFADPEKVHRTDYDGEFLKLHGTFTVPRSAQGEPVILQAGASGRGQRFAGRWADVVFTSYADKAKGVEQYQSLRQAIVDAGRDPDQVVIAPAVNVITGENQEIVELKRQILTGLAREEDGLALLCEVLNVDFSNRPMDEPFSDEELAEMSWQGLRDRVIAVSGNKNPSVRDFVNHSGRGRISDGALFIGTPTQVADQMEDWFGEACDGFVVMATSVPGTYEEFARFIVPELQRRGLTKSEYPGTTLRSSIGLAKPDPSRLTVGAARG